MSSRSAIEAKLREIQSEVDTTTTAAMPAGIALGTLLVGSAVGVAYLLGQRGSKKQTTIIEVRRQ